MICEQDKSKEHTQSDYREHTPSRIKSKKYTPIHLKINYLKTKKNILKDAINNKLTSI